MQIISLVGSIGRTSVHHSLFILYGVDEFLEGKRLWLIVVLQLHVTFYKETLLKRT